MATVRTGGLEVVHRRVKRVDLITPERFNLVGLDFPLEVPAGCGLTNLCKHD